MCVCVCVCVRKFVIVYITGSFTIPKMGPNWMKYLGKRTVHS